MPKIKNILIFVGIGVALVAIYVFLIKPKPPVDSLVSSTPSTAVSNSVSTDDNSLITQDFLNLLLNVKNIKLNDAIFSDVAFTNLDGSHSITLTQDGTEGRPNPFAPLGSDISAAANNSIVNPIVPTTP